MASVREHTPRPLSGHWQRTDWIIAVVLGVAGVELVYLSDFLGMLSKETSPHLSALGALVMAAPLGLRRRHPLAVGVAVATLYVVLGEFIGIEVYASQVVLFIAFYTIGAWCPDRTLATRVRIGIIAAMGVWLIYGFITGFYDPVTGERGVNAYLAFSGIMALTNIAYFTGGWVFGDRSWRQAIEQDELTRAHAEIRAQQDQLQEQAVRLERLRIARELHDVVAHHVTAMGVQAGAARMLLERSPEAAAQHLKDVEGSSRHAVAELQTMVRTLRDDDSGNDALPGLDDLEALVAEADALGSQRVRLERIGDAPAVPPATALALYRVAQEALTNARKHAGPHAQVVVRLRSQTDRVELEVSDDGRARRTATSTTRAPGTRMGLVGMRERMESVGGDVEAGPKPNGGWLVRATLSTRAHTEDTLDTEGTTSVPTGQTGVRA